MTNRDHMHGHAQLAALLFIEQFNVPGVETMTVLLVSVSFVGQ